MCISSFTAEGSSKMISLGPCKKVCKMSIATRKSAKKYNVAMLSLSQHSHIWLNFLLKKIVSIAASRGW